MERCTSRCDELRALAPVVLCSAVLCACASTPVAETASNGVTVKLVEACTDGTRTILKLCTELDAQHWGLDGASFDSPEGAYFETGVNIMQDGRPFASTSSGYTSDPVFDDITRVAAVQQELVFPGSPAPEDEMSLEATVTINNAPGYHEITGMSPIAFRVTSCE